MEGGEKIDGESDIKNEGGFSAKNDTSRRRTGVKRRQ